MDWSPLLSSNLSHPSRQSPSGVLQTLRTNTIIFITRIYSACPTLCHPTDHNTSGFPVHQRLPEITQTLVKLKLELVMPSNHLSLCCPLLLLPSIFPSIRVFSNESVYCIRWPKYWSFSLSISPSNEYSGLISFKIDWFDLLAGQGTLKSLLQHHSSKALILWHSAFFIVQISHPYMTTGKAIALTRWTFVGKVMSLLFNMLSRLVIAFLAWSKCLLISWLQSPSALTERLTWTELPPLLPQEWTRLWLSQSGTGAQARKNGRVSLSFISCLFFLFFILVAFS